MPSTAEADWARAHPDERLVIGVAVDGSSIGDKALAVAAGFFKEKRGDKARARAPQHAAVHSSLPAAAARCAYARNSLRAAELLLCTGSARQLAAPAMLLCQSFTQCKHYALSPAVTAGAASHQ